MDRRQRIVILVFGLLMLAGCAHAGDDREEAVCNSVLEPLAFWMWNRSAGTPRPLDAVLLPGVEPIRYTTRDGRLLHGFRLPARSPSRGTLLAMQGNATLAERLILQLTAYAAAGYSVYVYDYRGYAHSQGRPRLKAIVEDYREIHAALGERESGERLLYGMSFGGIVLLNVIGIGAAFDRAVIDSTPGRISGYGCPERYDPVANLPADSSRLLVINGAHDRVVPAADSGELLEAAAARGARTMHSPDFDHPFMDREPRIRDERENLIRSFLLPSAK